MIPMQKQLRQIEHKLKGGQGFFANVGWMRGMLLWTRMSTYLFGSFISIMHNATSSMQT